MDEPTPVEIVMTDRFVTIKQLVEEYCSVSEDLVRHWIRHEGLKTYPGSKKFDSKKPVKLILLSDFFAWMKWRRQRREEAMSGLSPEAWEMINKLRAKGAL